MRYDIQFGTSQADASEILQDSDFRINFVQDDLGSIEIEAQSIIKLGRQSSQSLWQRLPLRRDGYGSHGGRSH